MATKLEQFEKQWKYHYENYSSYEGIAHEKNSARYFWKAALEWALSHKKPIKYNDYKFDYIKTDVIEAELTSYAEEELGNEI